MSNFTVSIARGLPWRKVLSDLGTPVANEVLPALVQCPLCRSGRMRIFFNDGLGEWFYCRGCGFSGNVVEMAAKAWGFSRIQATLYRIANRYLIVPEEMTPWRVERYIVDHVERRQRLLAFWDASRKTLARHPTAEMQALVRAVTSLQRFDHPDWLQRGGLLIGACTRLDAERCPFPGSTRYRSLSNRYGHGAGRQGIFRGGGWKDLIVTPFWHLPGLLAGFLFIGRGADATQGDFVYKPLQPLYQGGHEAGIQNIDAFFGRPHCLLGNTVFVLPDVPTALAAEVAWMRSSFTVPPIVATFEDSKLATRSIWSRLPERDLVFLSPQFDVRILLQAKHANAPIAVNCLPQEELQWNLGHSDPLDWLRMAKRYARPWQTALRDRLSRLPVNEAEALLRQVDFDWPELRDFIQGCPPGLKERLEPLLNSHLFPRQTRGFGCVVSERDDAWYLEPSQELLANCVVRIEQILITAKKKRIYYRGHIRFKGKQIPFTERSNVIERGVFGWASKLLREAGKGQLIHRRTWPYNITALAASFHKPESFAQADTVGFRPGPLRFSFPRFSMTLSGDISDPLPLIASGDVPAANLERPQALTSEEIAALSTVSVETMTVWAMVACLMDRLVIGASSRRPSGIALVGAGAEVMGCQAAGFLGCIETRIPLRQRTRKIVDQLRSACGQPTGHLLSPAA